MYGQYITVIMEGVNYGDVSSCDLPTHVSALVAGIAPISGAYCTCLCAWPRTSWSPQRVLSVGPPKISIWSLPVWWRNCVTLWPSWHVCRAVGKIFAHGEYISGIQLTSNANTPVGFCCAICIPYSAFKDRGPIFPYGSLKAHKAFLVRSTRCDLPVISIKGRHLSTW